MILVDRRVVDGEAARIELRELVVSHSARELDLPVEPELPGDVLEAVLVGTVAGDDHLEAVPRRSCLEQEVDALGAVEAAHREDEIPVLVAAVVQ